MERTGRIENEGIDRFIEIRAVRGGQFPIARHPAPDSVNLHQVAEPAELERVRKEAGAQGTQRKRFNCSSEKRRTCVQDSAMHHALTRSAGYDSQSPARFVQPVLELAGKAPIRCDQVRKLVQDEWPRPADLISLGRESREERPPSGILDIREAGKPLGYRGRQVAALNLRRGILRNCVESVASPTPLN